MNIKDFQEQLIEYSKEIGIDKIGFTTADPFIQLKERLKLQKKLNYQSGFESDDVDARTDAKKILSEAQSIISIALAYPNKMAGAPQSKKGETRGIFCRSSWGEDYHRVLKRKLVELEAYILLHLPNSKVQSMVDTGELVDRAVAERAGIGWSGKNCSIITPEFGSYVYLGEIITSIPFSPSTPIEDQCGECTKCIDVCPTGAIVGPGQLNAKHCVSFLTQTKEMIPLEFRERIGNRIYGCDSCQTICPKNKGLDFHLHEEMEPDPETVKPLLRSLLNVSNREFKTKYGYLSGSWRGKNPIQRNAIIALAHFKDESAVDELKQLVKQDPRPVIRGTAVWAISKIEGEKSKSYLENCLLTENDDIVMEEIKNAIDNF
ncbi:tRNA epoxyqueuosine(34) reductase QueG [Bacillus sp. RG28]|uniref:tRNA epoxyqueuosine(34) reductase QueG n=1 Tax=Gottfriedia endophytica TaxID=2820819 RepID=A0A940SJL0_9BACI|nr:tRNA epoxyqueuosine(34) reductase QueG [Gottfriedia endophytica]MBP0725581.1 tRNA epoxyqueuosine(34) reductase QueG [Gottfriedia endophytica]